MVSETSKDDLIRSQTLPQGWIYANLDDLTIKITDGEHFSPKNKHSGIPFLSAKDVRDDKAVFDNAVFVDEVDAIRYRERCDPDKGDILIVSRGATVGRCCIVQSDQIFCLLGSVILIKPNKKISNKFLLYSLKSHTGFKQLIKISGSTAQQAIYLRDIKKVKIPLPPFPEQHRIVTKIEELLTQLDAGVASLKKVQAHLKRYRQAVLKAAFEGRLTQEWREEHKGEIEPAKVLLEKYNADLKKRTNGKAKLPLPLEKNELQQLPNLWIWTKIGEFVEIVRGGSPRPAGSPRYFGGNIPWITVGELTKDETIYLTKVSSFVTEEGRENSRFINADTLLLTNSGATLGVPKITLIDGCINDGSVALLGLDPIPKLYLYYFLKSQTKRLRQINQGAAQPNLNTDIVRNIVVPFPPLEEQKEVINEVERHFSQIDHLENTIITSLRQAESLRQSILKRAFEGKLVPQDPNDEPASILLERIKAEKARHATETKKGKTLQPKSPKRKIKNGN